MQKYEDLHIPISTNLTPISSMKPNPMKQTSLAYGKNPLYSKFSPKSHSGATKNANYSSDNQNERKSMVLSESAINVGESRMSAKRE